MCFSVTASFTLGVVLIPVGIYTIKRAARLPSSYMLLALMPLLFGFQQILEGVVWQGLASGEVLLTRSAALGFNFFALLFWLVWAPLCCYCLESNTLKKKLFFVLMLLGLVHGLSMYLPLLLYQDWLTVEIAGHSIRYRLQLLHYDYMPIVFRHLLYPLIILIPLLLSSNIYLKVFGGIILVSLLVTKLYFNYALISVWCYFAAVTSVYILFIMVRSAKGMAKKGE